MDMSGYYLFEKGSPLFGQMHDNIAAVFGITLTANKFSLLKIIYYHCDIALAFKDFTCNIPLAKWAVMIKHLKHGKLTEAQFDLREVLMTSSGNGFSRPHEFDVGG